MPEYTYKLLGGGHTQRGKNGKPETFKRGDTFATTVDLHRLFGPAAPAKFLLISTNDPALTRQQASPAPAPINYEEEVPDGPIDDGAFESMTVLELRNYAKEEGIDLGTAKKKAEVIAIIRDSLSESDEEEDEEYAEDAEDDAYEEEDE